jgi:urease accessory protein
MFDAISPSDHKVENTALGEARVSFRQDRGKTVLRDLYASDPLRVLFPTPGHGDIFQAVIATTSGGMVCGDQLDIQITIEADAGAIVTPQAAEKIYRSTGSDAEVEVHIRAAPNAWLEWLPQETILFDTARLRRTTFVEAAPGARVLAGEILVFGRLARGERFATGLVHDAWEVRRNDTLIWADALRMEGDIDAVRDHPAGLAGATAAATAIFVADDAADGLAVARQILATSPDTVRCGVSLVNGILVMRWLSEDAQILRRIFGEFWAAFRAEVGTLPGVLPRIWHV